MIGVIHRKAYPMKFDPDKHHRRSIRLRDYDYSGAGTYFLTVCTHGRACLFGEIVGGQMILSKIGSENQRTEYFLKKAKRPPCRFGVFR